MVAKTPEDIRMFARTVKGRGLKIYNRNLKKRSPNYIDKKRDAICARLFNGEGERVGERGKYMS